MNYKWMPAYRVCAKVVCSASGETSECHPLGTNNRLRVLQVNRWEIWGNRCKARKVRIKRCKASWLLVAFRMAAIILLCQKFWKATGHISVSLPFSSNTCFQFSEETAGPNPGEPEAYIVFTFLSTITAGWLLWVAGVYGDPVNWCTKQPIKR